MSWLWLEIIYLAFSDQSQWHDHDGFPNIWKWNLEKVKYNKNQQLLRQQYWDNLIFQILKCLKKQSSKKAANWRRLLHINLVRMLYSKIWMVYFYVLIGRYRGTCLSKLMQLRSKLCLSMLLCFHLFIFHNCNYLCFFIVWKYQGMQFFPFECFWTYIEATWKSSTWATSCK